MSLLSQSPRFFFFHKQVSCISNNYKWSEITKLLRTQKKEKFCWFWIVEVRDLIWNCFIGLCFALQQRRIWVEEKSWEPPIYYYYYLKFSYVFTYTTRPSISACLLLLSYILLSFFFAFVHNFCLLCFYFFVKRRKYKRKNLSSNLKECTWHTPRQDLWKTLRDVSSSNKCVWRFKSKSKKIGIDADTKLWTMYCLSAQTSSETFFLSSIHSALKLTQRSALITSGVNSQDGYGCININ